jgi:hypothetical protein
MGDDGLSDFELGLPAATISGIIDGTAVAAVDVVAFDGRSMIDVDNVSCDLLLEYP